MSVFVSPGVYSIEKDISNVVSNIATTVAGLVGYSTRGNVDDLVLITSKKDFIEEYGEPVAGSHFHHTAMAFLEWGKRLYCYRVHKNALYGGAHILKTGETHAAFAAGKSANTAFDADSSYTSAITAFQIYCKDPGTWNNSIGIAITDWKGASETEITERYTFKIKVYTKDDDGNWYPTPVETFKVSREDKLDGYGNSLYLETRINDTSKYIVVRDNTALAYTTVIDELDVDVSGDPQLTLAGGSNGDTVTSAELILGWDKFSNPDDVDVRMLLNGGETDVEVQSKMKTVAETRADCVAILDIPEAYNNVTNTSDLLTWRDDTQNFNTSYTALYAPWVKIYDTYTDTIKNVPPSGYVGAQFAYNDYVAEAWYAPAGFNRGQLNVLGLTQVYTAGERDALYEKQINPLQTFRGEGNVIWGQKTQQVKASALDRINVRRLLITIEKSIAISLRQFVFEPNSELTRFRIVAMLNEYLDRLSSQGAFQTELGDNGYYVLCDETNNTPAVIDANELHVDVFIKPSRAAEFIKLQTVVTSTGAKFDELISRGVMF